MPLNVLPVIHPCPLQLRVIKFEAERLDEMQRRACGRTEPRYVARVRRNFGFKQNDVHSGSSFLNMTTIPTGTSMQATASSTARIQLVGLSTPSRISISM